MIGRRVTHGTAQHSDPEHVQLLSPDILGTHEDDTLHAELGADGRSGNSMLPCTRLGNDSLLA